MTTPVISVAGWKNSGKTTLITKIVAELRRRNVRVATIKHAHHAFEIDREGTDSFRHRDAGAFEVAIVSARRWAIIHEIGDEGEPTLAEVLKMLSPADVVIIEGYKPAPIPKIEVRRLSAARTEPLAETDPNVVAIAADHPCTSVRLPVFDLDDVGGIVDFVVAFCRLGKAGTSRSGGV